jgi:hypothetical protein
VARRFNKDRIAVVPTISMDHGGVTEISNDQWSGSAYGGLGIGGEGERKRKDWMEGVGL